MRRLIPLLFFAALACHNEPPAPDSAPEAPPQEHKVIDLTPPDGPAKVRIDNEEETYTAEQWADLCHAAMTGSRQDLDVARQACESALQKNPKMIGAKLNLAILDARGGDFDAAQALLDEVQQANPKLVDLYRVRGEVWAGQGDDAKTLAAWQKAVDLAQDPRELGAPFFFNVSTLHARQHHEAEALRACEIALTLDPDYVPAQLQKGALLGVLGRTGEALEYLEGLRETLAAEPRLWFNLARLYELQGRTAQRREALQKFIDTAKPPEAYAAQLAWARGELQQSTAPETKP